MHWRVHNRQTSIMHAVHLTLVFHMNMFYIIFSQKTLVLFTLDTEPLSVINYLPGCTYHLLYSYSGKSCKQLLCVKRCIKHKRDLWWVQKMLKSARVEIPQFKPRIELHQDSNALLFNLVNLSQIYLNSLV